MRESHNHKIGYIGKSVPDTMERAKRTVVILSGTARQPIPALLKNYA